VDKSFASSPAEDFAGLSVPERARLCRVHARQARQLAALNNHTQRAYLKIAEEWETLAAEIEQAIRSTAAE
jgi:hypothetical protein